MKLKQEQTSFINYLKVFKGLLFFGALLLANSLSAQQVNVTLLSGPASEAGLATATFRITMSAPRLTPTTINYTLTGSAVEGDDYQVIGSVVIPLIQTSVDVMVTPMDDNLVEGDNDVIFTLDASVQYTIGINNEATAIIEDDDVGVVNLDLDTSVINGYRPNAFEGGQNGQFRLNIDKENATGAQLLVSFTISGTSTPGPGAGAGFDHNLTGAVNAATNAATFPEGPLTRNINVVPFDDTVSESEKTVIMTLTGTNNPLYTIGPSNAATVTIFDDDCAAGDVAPVLNNNPTAFCGAFNVPLDDYLQSTRPPGAGLVWSTNSDPSVMADWVPFPNDSPVSQPGTYYGFFRDEINECYSPTVTLVLTQSFQPSAGTATNASRCNETGFGEPTAIDLDNTLSGQDAGGTWSYISGGTGNPGINGSNVVNFNGDPEGNYVFRYTVVGVAPCTNDTEDVTITVTGCDPCVAGNTAPALNTGIPTTVCDVFTNSFNDYTTSSAPAGTVLTWSTSADPLNTNAHLTPAQASNPPVVGGTYYGFFYDAVNSCASPTLEIDIVLNVTPTLSAVTGNERCGEGTLVLGAIASDNATINWYAAATGGSIIGTGASFTTPTIATTTSFFAEATLNGCASERQEAIAVVEQQPSSGTLQNGGNASACNVAANGPTILDLDDLISGEDAGAWAYTSGPFADFTIPSNNILNFEGRPDGDYVFTYTTTGAEAPCENESSVLTISVNDCDVDTDMDGLFDGPEAILGTDPNNPDTDGDGINDGLEVGDDLDNPLDSDLDGEGMASPDGIIDALDSNILDVDSDGVVDQLDPSNDNPCVPTRLNGVCDFDGDGIPDSDEIADGSDPDDPCDPDLENSACNAEVDLEVLKAVDNINALIGESVVFTITVNNLSENKASQIIIGDLLESGFEYVSHSPAVEQYNPDTGEWAIPLIDAMDNAVLEITVNILEGGTYTNIAELLDVFQTDTNAANDRSEPITLPIELPEGIDLVLEKTALSANPLVNEEVVFTVKVINASIDANPVNNIEVSDVLDTENFEYIDHNTLVGEYDVGSGIWSIPSIEKGQEVLLEIRVRVPNEGEFTNTASIIRSSPADGNPSNNEATVAITVSLPTPAEVGFLFNQFSPNGDGTNDILKINRMNSETNQEVEVLYNVQIFNRYGNLVYEANNKSESEVWDGSWKGKDAPNGTYFYTMNLDIGDGPKLKKGWIQLIR